MCCVLQKVGSGVCTDMDLMDFFCVVQPGEKWISRCNKACSWIAHSGSLERNKGSGIFFSLFSNVRSLFSLSWFFLQCGLSSALLLLPQACLHLSSTCLSPSPFFTYSFNEWCKEVSVALLTDLSPVSCFQKISKYIWRAAKWGFCWPGKECDFIERIDMLCSLTLFVYLFSALYQLSC